MTLQIHGRRVASAFDLLGHDENAMTAALGFALERAPAFRRALIGALGGPRTDGDVSLSLQTARGANGVTDLEIRLGSRFLGVVEAKQGAWLPSVDQLTKYAHVLASSRVDTVSLATLSDVTVGFATATLPREIGGIPVRHLTWRHVVRLASECERREPIAARRVLRDLQAFLGGMLGMDSLYSNRVFVVSLGRGAPAGWPLSWIDIVVARGKYFYPVAKNWPAPPNYIGFRYSGQLQSIHHVAAVDIFSDPQSLFPEVPAQRWDPHYILTLGPPLRPAGRVPNGPRIQMSNRVWCFLDTLLTSASISDALTETERRIERWNSERAV